PEQEQRLTEYLLTRKPHACGTGDWRYEMHDLVFMYLDTGARYCEIARLEWSQVDLKQKTIELWRNKTKTESFIYMTDRVHQILQRRSEHKMHDRWVFTNWKRTDHRRLSTMTLNDVRLLLGHSSIQTTQRYQHLESNDVSPRAVAILNQQNVERNRSKLKVVGGKN